MKKITILLVFILSVISFSISTVHADSLKTPKIIYTDSILNKIGYVSLESPYEDASIYYTTDGSIPQKNKKGTKLYTNPIKINKTTLIKCRIYKDGMHSKVISKRIIYLNPVKINSIKLYDGGVSLKWNINEYSDGYLIYRKDKSTHKWKLIKKINDSSTSEYIDKNISWNNKYSYYVITFLRNHKSLHRKMYKSIVTKHDHVYEEVKRITPTCTKNGKCFLRCKKCNAEKTKSLKKKGHRIITTKEGYYSVDKCKNCGEICSKYLSKDIPKYWEDEVIDSLNKINSRKLPGYIFFTDVHWDTNAKKSPCLVNYISNISKPHFIGYGGDIVTGHRTDKANVYNDFNNFLNSLEYRVFLTTGNHDMNTCGNDDVNSYLTTTDLYENLYKRELNYASVNPETLVSVLDDNKNKIRYISFIFDDQNQIPTNTLEQIEKNIMPLSSDWSIVLFSHAYWHFFYSGEDLLPYYSGKKLSESLLDIQNKSEANIILWHVSHVHRDYSQIIHKGDSSILVVSTSSDNYTQSEPYGGPKMIKSTSSEQVIDYVQIDKIRKQIFFTRIGAGEDRIFNY